MVDTGFVVSDRDRLVAYCRCRRGRPHEAGTNSRQTKRHIRRLICVPSRGRTAVAGSSRPCWTVALIRSLLPGGPTLLQPDTIKLMMTNQFPEAVWVRFAALGELQGKGYGLAGALILEPSAFDHQDARGELLGRTCKHPMVDFA